MKLFLSLILISLSAFAVPTNQEIEVIHGQKGFRNYVKNPTCKRNVSDITASSVAAVKNTSSALDDISDCTWNPTASSQTLKWQVNTWALGLKGWNCEARILYSGDASLVKAYVNQNSVKITADYTLLNTGSNSSFTQPINYPCGDGSVATEVVLESTGDAANVQYAVYTGEATNIGIASEMRPLGSLTYAPTTNCAWTISSGSYSDLAADTDCPTPTVTGQVTAPGTKIAGAVLNNIPPGRIIAIQQYSLGSTGGAASASARLSDGTNFDGHCTGSSTNNLDFWACNVTSVFNYTTAQSSLTYQIQALRSVNGFVNNQDTGTVGFKIDFYWMPSASQTSGVRMDQSNYDWRSYTPTFTGFGTTVTSIECQEKRQGADNLIRCKAISDSPTAVEGRVSLPGTLVSSTSKIPSIQKAGGFIRSGNYAGSVFGTHTLIEPAKSYVVFGIEGTGASGFTKQNGSGLVGASETFYFDARIPIEGWVENQNAPLIVGGVTSTYAGNMRTQVATISDTGVVSNEYGDWISGNCSVATTNDFTCDFVSGTFSARPVCTTQAFGDDDTFTPSASPKTITASQIVYNTAKAAVAVFALPVELTCTGPR